MTTGTAAMLMFCAAVIFIAVIGIARTAHLLREDRPDGGRAILPGSDARDEPDGQV